MKKEKYKIVIEETISKEFEVEAEDAEGALQTAQDKYNSGEFVIDTCNVNSRQMAVMEPDNEQTEFKEF